MVSRKLDTAQVSGQVVTSSRTPSAVVELVAMPVVVVAVTATRPFRPQVVPLFDLMSAFQHVG